MIFLTYVILKQGNFSSECLKFTIAIDSHRQNSGHSLPFTDDCTCSILQCKVMERSVNLGPLEYMDNYTIYIILRCKTMDRKVNVILLNYMDTYSFLKSRQGVKD